MGPMIRTDEEEDYKSPQWLVPMLRGIYFVPCSIHADSNKNERNLFCLDCAGNAFCSYCLVKPRDHHVVQVQYLFFFFSQISDCFCFKCKMGLNCRYRDLSYHNVVRVNEIQKYIISCVQSRMLILYPYWIICDYFAK